MAIFNSYIELQEGTFIIWDEFLMIINLIIQI